MVPSHLIFLVEQPSLEAFLLALLPRILPDGCTFEVHAFAGKTDMLRKLDSRLRGYARFLPPHWRILIVVDRDEDDCRELKARLETSAAAARLQTRRTAGGAPWQVATRIAVEELESWYFGDWQAVCAAFDRVPTNVIGKERFRDPDGIRGGTWEAFEQVLQRYGHFRGGLRKIEAARAVADHIDVNRCTSRSFQHFCTAVREAAAGTAAAR